MTNSAVRAVRSPSVRGWRVGVRASRSADPTSLTLSRRSVIGRTQERNCWKCGDHFILRRLRTLMHVVLHHNSFLPPSHRSVETRSRRESTESSGRGRQETSGIYTGGVGSTQSGRWNRQSRSSPQSPNRIRAQSQSRHGRDQAFLEPHP